MKIVVFSDSHGAVGDMLDTIEMVNPAMMIHLGDCVADAELVSSICTGLPVRQVSGNCDFPREEIKAEQLVTIGGKKLFVCHGHRYNVKQSEQALIARAKALGADAAFYGHTHIPSVGMRDGIWVVNPGTVSGCRTGTKSFCLVEIDGDNIAVSNKLL